MLSLCTSLRHFLFLKILLPTQHSIFYYQFPVCGHPQNHHFHLHFRMKIKCFTAFQHLLLLFLICKNTVGPQHYSPYLLLVPWGRNTLSPIPHTKNCRKSSKMQLTKNLSTTQNVTNLLLTMSPKRPIYIAMLHNPHHKTTLHRQNDCLTWH